MERDRIRAAESAVAEVPGDREGLRAPLDILVLRVLEGYKDLWDSRDQQEPLAHKVHRDLWARLGQRDRWDHRGPWVRRESKDQRDQPGQRGR